MPLYIRDDEVDALAEQYRVESGSKNKTEAVRKALVDQLEALKAAKNLTEKISAVQRKARKAGLGGADVS